MHQHLPFILSILSLIISIFTIYKTYKNRKEIHDQVIKDVIEHPHLAKTAMRVFPEWKEEIIRITNKQN